MTAKHILKLARLGTYNSNHFFRVDKVHSARHIHLICAGMTWGDCCITAGLILR